MTKQTLPSRFVAKNPVYDTCCVADQDCESPANLEPVVPAKHACFRCGLAVCEKCSTRRKYLYYGRQRLCNDCQVEYDGHDKTVMRRLLRLV